MLERESLDCALFVTTQFDNDYGDTTISRLHLR